MKPENFTFLGAILLLFGITILIFPIFIDYYKDMKRNEQYDYWQKVFLDNSEELIETNDSFEVYLPSLKAKPKLIKTKDVVFYWIRKPINELGKKAKKKLEEL